MAPQWRKSSHSSGTGGQCVEVAALSPSVAVRDSKDPDGPMLSFDAATWASFTSVIKAGLHDLGCPAPVTVRFTVNDGGVSVGDATVAP